MAGHEHLNPRLSKVMKKRQDRGVGGGGEGRRGAELWLLNVACLFRRKNKLNYDKCLFRFAVEHA